MGLVNRRFIMHVLGLTVHMHKILTSDRKPVTRERLYNFKNL